MQTWMYLLLLEGLMNNVIPGCAVNLARFAVCGTSINGKIGILNWFKDVVPAYRFKREISKSGGYAYVSKVDNIDGLYSDIQKTSFNL